MCLKTHTFLGAKQNILKREPSSNLLVNPETTKPTTYALSQGSLHGYCLAGRFKNVVTKTRPPSRVSPRPRKSDVKLTSNSRPGLSLEYWKLLVGHSKPWPQNIANQLEVSWRPQNTQKIRPQTSRLTSYPNYGPGSLLRTLSGRRLSLTRRRRRRPVLTAYPLGRYRSDEEGLAPAGEIVTRLANYGRDSNFPTTVHSGPLNLPNWGGTPEPECCSAVPTGPWWRHYPPSSREDVYTDKRSAHNILRYGYFVYTPLFTHSHRGHVHDSS